MKKTSLGLIICFVALYGILFPGKCYGWEYDEFADIHVTYYQEIGGRTIELGEIEDKAEIGSVYIPQIPVYEQLHYVKMIPQGGICVSDNTDYKMQVILSDNKKNGFEKMALPETAVVYYLEAETGKELDVQYHNTDGNSFTFSAEETVFQDGIGYRLSAEENNVKSLNIDDMGVLTYYYEANEPKEQNIIANTGSGGGTGVKLKEAVDSPAHIKIDGDTHTPFLSGYPDNTFRPQQYVTRAEVAVIFYRLMQPQAQSIETKNSYFDVGPGAWYQQAVAFLTGEGVFSGYPDGSFKAEKPITRAEFSVIAFMFDNLDLTDINFFSDIKSDYWAIAYINSSYQKGWVNSLTANDFLPESFMTRAEVATFINRMLGRRPDYDGIPEGLNTFVDLDMNHWAFSDIMEATVSHGYKLEDGKEVWTTGK